MVTLLRTLSLKVIHVVVIVVMGLERRYLLMQITLYLTH